MLKPTGFYPLLVVDTTAKRVVSQVGAAVLVAAAGKVGLDRALSAASAPWRPRLAVHDPGKILLDLAVSVAIGGDCAADIAQLRSEPAVFGQVASDPTVSQLIDTLAADAMAVLAAINAARAGVRAAAWRLAGKDAPDHEIHAGRPLVIDLDATLITHTLKRSWQHRLSRTGSGTIRWDRGVTTALRAPVNRCRCCSVGVTPGLTPPPTIAVTKDALRQLPLHREGSGRIGRKVLVRTDGAGGTHDFVKWLAGQGLSYSLGFGLTEDMVARLETIPDQAWTAAYDAEGKVRGGAWVTELTEFERGEQ